VESTNGNPESSIGNPESTIVNQQSWNRQSAIVDPSIDDPQSTIRNRRARALPICAFPAASARSHRSARAHPAGASAA
jgi:hypothetical protein